MRTIAILVILLAILYARFGLPWEKRLYSIDELIGPAGEAVTRIFDI